MSDRNRMLWSAVAIVVIVGAYLDVLPTTARAADNKACGLLTPAKIEAALGVKVSTFTEGAGGFCQGIAPTVRVMLRVAAKSSTRDRAAKGIEIAKQMGGQVDVKTFGSITCSTLVPPESLVSEVGFNTTCSTTKGDSIAAVEVTAKSRTDMVPIEKLRSLAEKMASRF